MQINTQELMVEVDNIHREMLNQPLLYQKYHGMYAEAMWKAAEAKRKLEREKSDLSIQMKANPKGYGLPKTSDETIKDAVMSNEDIDALLEEYNKLYRESKVLEGIVKALEQRSQLLQSESRLMVMGFFQETTGVSTDYQNFMNAHMDKVKLAIDARNDQSQEPTEEVNENQ